ncbi:hypothetical protein GGU10DRAFT_380382 [Lentinula aff. detonsa]|uniref:Uncharacterized protein n=1 Tax=Lentinula aff. detonsa TaxID=2804958 RepID=A0AA38NJD9_9AGAR|nr:hypothetical protein GGU10DRAFT_380382 [Lentinula aff. detonsa]
MAPSNPPEVVEVFPGATGPPMMLNGKEWDRETIVSRVDSALDVVLKMVRSKACPEDLHSNNIASLPTLLIKSPSWLQSFGRHISKQREITTSGFHHVWEAVRLKQHKKLETEIPNLFVLNDGPVLDSLTDQSETTRSEEIGLKMPSVSFLVESSTKRCGNGAMVSGCKFPLLFNKAEPMFEPRITGRNETLFDNYGIPRKVAEDSELTWYAFKPDASLFRGHKPYLVVEFESASCSPKYQEDHIRLRLYGGILVRWMRRISGRHFILPALYVWTNGQCDLLFLYEDEGQIQYVFEEHDLGTLLGRLKLFRTILNMMDRVPVEWLSDKWLHQMQVLGLEMKKSKTEKTKLTSSTQSSAPSVDPVDAHHTAFTSTTAAVATPTYPTDDIEYLLSSH